MQERTATLNLDSDAAMNMPDAQAVFEREPRGERNRFTYPSGSRQLDGFTLKRGIGHGGFGEVYYATSDAGKEVALKLIRRNLSIELRGVMQCLNLKHPNLVALYDVKHDASDDTWVVMEYVAGEQLEDVCARYPQGLPRDQAMAWMHGICAGVAYLHDRGIVHRDLKPGNIFNDEGLVKIGDYGLSKFISASRRSGQTESVGTVHYMAPEVANGRYGKEIDIYALGVILYELLTGRVPFEGESVGEVLMKHLTAQPDLSALDEPFRTIVARTLEKDPQKRLSSVAEFVSLLPPPPSGTPRVQPTLMADGSPYVAPQVASAMPAAMIAGVNGAAVLTPASTPATGLRLPGEPVWTAVRDAGVRTWRAWSGAQIGAFPKFILLFFGLIGLIVVASVLIVPLVAAIELYIIYLVFWLLALPVVKLVGRPITPPLGWPSRAQPPAQSVAAPVAQAVYVAPPLAPMPAVTLPHYSHDHQHRPRRREAAMAALVLKPARERFTDLLGSLLLSTLVSGLAMTLIFIVQRDTPVNLLVAMGLTSTLGAWGVLTSAKFWEGTVGEPVLRRVVLLGVGLALGAATFGIYQALMVEPIYTGREPPGIAPQYLPNGGIGMFANSKGQLLLPMYLAYFGFLLPVLKWWQQADPLRKQRISLWSTFLCVAWAGLLSRFWEFPQSQGMLIAGTISVAIQLASPWMDRNQRKQAA